MTAQAQPTTRATHVQDLGTEAWTLTDATSQGEWPALVPGSVLLDLLQVGVLPDPFYRENEKAVAWVGEQPWTYRCAFEPDPQLWEHPRQILRFEGLDTLATVSLNGTVLLTADNMHRTWEVDITGKVRVGVNDLVVEFASPLAAVRELQGQRPLPGWYQMASIEGSGHLRKQLSNFGWDWGPALVTSGIWRPVQLLGTHASRLTDLLITQDHAVPGQVLLSVSAGFDGPRPPGTIVDVTVRGPDGEIVATGRGADGDVSLVVEHPQLWWPNGLGAQPLYDVTVRLVDELGEPLDTTRRRIGLRTLELVRTEDDRGESFAFACNGQAFFAKGANWIPADAVVGRATPQSVRQLLADAVACHMNMLRVWGGGVYEEDDFYDACDELGLCVWQDVAFACAAFPGDDPAYLDNVLAEVADNARRLRHHPSLALWCGNNELEMGLVGDGWTEHHMSWEDYTPLMDELLPQAFAEHDPGRAYWPASPHTPGSNRKDADDPSRGDAHLWKVWHGGQRATWYRTSDHRFVSEFGFQGFPHPETIESFTEPEDRDLASPVMELHQKADVAGASGSAELSRQLVQHFRAPSSWEGLVWQTQMLQAWAVSTGIEHWRRNMPTTMGTLYWQLNDCWPGPSWSSIDSAGRWKALHHAVRRCYAPIMLSLVEDVATSTVAVHVTSDLPVEAPVRVEWFVTTCAGEVLSAGLLVETVSARSNRQVGVIDAQSALQERTDRDVLVWARLESDDTQTVLATFVPPKHLQLADPKLDVEVDGEVVTITADAPALWVWVDVPGRETRPSDNFFHLPCGSRSIVVPGGAAGVLVRSLTDTVRSPSLALRV